MSDFFAEKLIKKKQDQKDLAKKAAGFCFILISLWLLLLSPLGIALTVVAVIVEVVIFRRCDVEYEYQYINGYFDVDKIYHKERRENIFSAKLDSLQMLAPEGSDALRRFGQVKTYDFTGGYGEEKVFAMIFSENGSMKKILFEPGENMVQGIACHYPDRTDLR